MNVRRRDKIWASLIFGIFCFFGAVNFVDYSDGSNMGGSRVFLFLIGLGFLIFCISEINEARKAYWLKRLFNEEQEGAGYHFKLH